jgi:hypothetical protein
VDAIAMLKFSNQFCLDEVSNCPKTYELLIMKTYKSEMNRVKGEAKYEDIKLLLATIVLPEITKHFMKSIWRKALFRI